MGILSLLKFRQNQFLKSKLGRLTGLERSKLVDDLKECVKLINEYLKILSSKEKLNEVIIEELNQIKEKVNSERITEISENEETIDDESLIKSEEVVVTLTHTGYIKEFLLTLTEHKKEVVKEEQG